MRRKDIQGGGWPKGFGHPPNPALRLIVREQIHTLDADCHKFKSRKNLCNEGLPVAAPLPCDTCQADPELTAVIGAWDRLPQVVRAGIVALIKAASQ
jgi:hypothetical protein